MQKLNRISFFGLKAYIVGKSHFWFLKYSQNVFYLQEKVLIFF
jgi:hypothetical protein